MNKSFVVFVKKNIRKIRIAMIVLSLAVFFAHSIFILISSDKNLITYKSALEENKMEMKGLQVNYLIDNSSYITIESKIAYADKLDYSLDMKEVNLYYKDRTDNMTVTATADKGSYELDKRIRAVGNLHGYINELHFITDEDGYIEYNYLKEIGNIGNGVTADSNNNIMKANEVFFNTKTEYVLFQNKVNVTYATK